MPEDLLQELETAALGSGSLEHIHALLSESVREVSRAMTGMSGSALLFENTWRRILMDVARGHTQEIQATRPRLLSAFEKRLILLKQTHELATRLRKIDASGVPTPDILLPEIDGMEQLKATVFDRWQTADDLEDLAARDYPLTTADLDRIGPNRQPPASYYVEESKPF